MVTLAWTILGQFYCPYSSDVLLLPLPGFFFSLFFCLFKLEGKKIKQSASFPTMFLSFFLHSNDIWQARLCNAWLVLLLSVPSGGQLTLLSVFNWYPFSTILLSIRFLHSLCQANWIFTGLTSKPSNQQTLE